MDKYEYRIRAEEINALIEKKQFAEAMKIADTIDWSRVKSVMMLCKISELYKYNRRFEDAKEILLLAYDRQPGGRKIVYSLCELCIKLEETVQAVEYYKEFVQVAPTDTRRFILQYRLYEAQDVSLEERIAVLEEYKKRDYREKWAYELAYLYHRIGLATRCVEECDELILWFGEGKYVNMAMELKMLHEPLSPSQQEKYDSRFRKVEPEEDVKAPEEESALSIEIKSVDVTKAKTAEIIPNAIKKSMEEADTIKVPEIKAVEQTEEEPQAQENEAETPNGVLPQEAQESFEEEIPLTEPDPDLDIQVKTVDVGEYNTINLQQELAQNISRMFAEEDMGAADATMALPIESIIDTTTQNGKVINSISDDAIKDALLAPLLQDAEEDTQITEEDLLASMEQERREKEEAEAERQRLEAERAEAERQRLEAERLEAERQRQEAERAEAERQRLEAERQEAERAEAERQRQEAERQRQEAERLEAERLEAERAEAERQRQEAERLEAERAEAERQRQEAERLEAERAEAERQRQEAERAEAERQRQEAERLEAERAEAERQRQEAERQRQEAERLEAERAEAERQRQEAERLEAERAEAERQRQEAERTAAPVTAGAIMAAEIAHAVTTGNTQSLGIGGRLDAGNTAVGAKNSEGDELVDEQITGQLSLLDIMNEWEETKKANEEKHIAEMREKVMKQTGPMFSNFDEVARASVTSDLDLINPVVDVFKDRTVGQDTTNQPQKTMNYDDPEDETDQQDLRLADRSDARESESQEIRKLLNTEEINGLEEKLLETLVEAEEEQKKEEEVPAFIPDIDFERPAESQIEEQPIKEERVIIAEEVETRGSSILAAMVNAKADPEEVSEKLPEPNVISSAAEAVQAMRRAESAAEAVQAMRRAESAAEAVQVTQSENPYAETMQAVRSEAPFEETVHAISQEELPLQQPEEYSYTQPEARLLTREEKELFGNIAPTRDLQEKVAGALDLLSLETATGNGIVVGENGTGRTTIAQNMVRYVQDKYPQFTGKILRITGEQLAARDVAQTLSSLENGALIIERAGSMEPDIEGNLLYQLEKLSLGGVLVVMEDTKEEIERLTLTYPQVEQIFTAKIEVEVLDNDGLVQFAKAYAKSQEYAIDEMGVLAVYTRISDMQTNEHAVTVEEVKEMVNGAIERAEKKSVKHFVDVLIGKRFDDEDMVVLREKDFSIE